MDLKEGNLSYSEDKCYSQMKKAVTKRTESRLKEV